ATPARPARTSTTITRWRPTAPCGSGDAFMAGDIDPSAPDMAARSLTSLYRSTSQPRIAFGRTKPIGLAPVWVDGFGFGRTKPIDLRHHSSACTDRTKSDRPG